MHLLVDEQSTHLVTTHRFRQPAGNGIGTALLQQLFPTEGDAQIAAHCQGKSAIKGGGHRRAGGTHVHAQHAFRWIAQVPEVLHQPAKSTGGGREWHRAPSAHGVNAGQLPHLVLRVECVQFCLGAEQVFLRQCRTHVVSDVQFGPLTHDVHHLPAQPGVARVQQTGAQFWFHKRAGQGRRLHQFEHGGYCATLYAPGDADHVGRGVADCAHALLVAQTFTSTIASQDCLDQ